jgi:hypothetical protein
MAEKDDDTEEPRAGDGGPADDGHLQPKGRRLSFGKVRRDLTEDELGSSGVQKMMLDELDRMDQSEIELKSVSEKYYVDKAALAVAQEKLKTHNAFDVLSTGSVAIGSLLFGAAFSFREGDTQFWIGISLSIVLIIIGVFAKVMRA